MIIISSCSVSAVGLGDAGEEEEREGGRQGKIEGGWAGKRNVRERESTGEAESEGRNEGGRQSLSDQKRNVADQAREEKKREEEVKSFLRTM